MTGHRSDSAYGIAARMLKGGEPEHAVRVALARAGFKRDTATKAISAQRAYGVGRPPEDDMRHWDEEARKANILHLVDLKRAGHSPTVTELRFRKDLDTPTRYVPPVAPSSYLGSSSAMCAELGAS